MGAQDCWNPVAASACGEPRLASSQQADGRAGGGGGTKSWDASEHLLWASLQGSIDVAGD